MTKSIHDASHIVNASCIGREPDLPDTVRCMTRDQAGRLERLRNEAGYASAAEAARACGVAEPTYRSYENGSRPLTVAAAKLIAPKFNRTWKQLMLGDDAASLEEVEVAAQLGRTLSRKPRVRRPTASAAPRKMVAIAELAVQAGAGGNDHIDASVVTEGGELLDQVREIGHWSLPADLTRDVTQTPPDRMKIITVVGNSMAPDFRPGQRVLVDTRDRRPSPPGVFVVWDGLGLVVKQVEYIPHSDPPTVRITSRNPEFKPYERGLGEAYIQGRVIGGWQWT